MKPDYYKHLNGHGDGVTVGIEETVRQVERLNYGAHRMLSAFIRCRRERHPDDKLANEIESLLERGLY